MPIYNRCKKCRALKPVGDMGDNGVCTDCMSLAIANKEQADKMAKINAGLEKDAKKAKKAEKKEAEAKAKEAEKVEAEAVQEREEKAKAAADVAADLVADNVFIIKKGDVTKTCNTFTQAAEAIGVHPQTVSRAIKAGKDTIGDWSVEYPSKEE